MRMNTKPRFTEKTHEGAPAARLTPLQHLRRSVMSCLLWEKGFYEDGEEIAARILRLAGEVSTEDLAAIAIEARTQMNLRHVPLLLLTALVKRGKGALVGDTIAKTVQRADELAELLAIYWKDGKRPLAKQMKVGLAAAFGQFDEYQLAKYDRAGTVRLRDVLFLTHPKPKDDEQAALWKRLAQGELTTPDTWEVALSGGANKKETFERLLREGKLGYLALLRNLRGMLAVGVDVALMSEAIAARRGADRVLPFRFVAAARACPAMEPALDHAMLAGLNKTPKLKGKTVVLVDVSFSMNASLSGKSDLNRIDAACALGAIINAEELRVFSFSDNVVEVPPRRGMAGVDVISKSQPHSGTQLGAALRKMPDCDRLIVITDEQSHDRVEAPKNAGRCYMLNVAGYQNGVGHGPWTRIDGFSENVLRYVHEIEE